VSKIINGGLDQYDKAIKGLAVKGLNKNKMCSTKTIFK